MSQVISLDQLPPELLQVIEAFKKGTMGVRSPVRHQLKDLRDPQNPQAKLHRPTFSWSADEDPERPASSYVHQDFPTLVFHAKKGEGLVKDQEGLDVALASGWQQTPIHVPNVSDYDAARAEFDSLSQEDKDLVLSLQREARIKHVQTLMAGLSKEDQAMVAGGGPDVAKRGPGRPKKADQV